MKSFTITKKVAKHGHQAIIVVPRVLEDELLRNNPKNNNGCYQIGGKMTEDKVFKDGDLVEVDANNGIVRKVK